MNQGQARGQNGQQGGMMSNPMGALFAMEALDGADNLLPFAMASGMGQNQRPRTAPVLEQVNPNTRPHQGMNMNTMAAAAMMDGGDLEKMMAAGYLMNQGAGQQ